MSTFIPKPLYPNVPAAPGVPPLLRSISATTTGIIAAGALLSADVASLTDGYAAQRWGIFSASGQQVLSPDSIVAFDYRQDYSLPDYPIEQGGFATYNKVTRPRGIRIVMSKGGSVVARQQFENAALAVAASLDLYTCTTPEASYTNMNVESRSFTRTVDRGAALLTVEFWMQEIRNAASGTVTTAQPSGAAVQNTGPVQPSTATPAQDAVAGVPVS